MSSFNFQELDIPDVFVENSKVAKRIVDEAVASHRDYWDAIDAMENHLKGAKPVPPEELKKQGMNWVSNWNYGKGSSKLEQIIAESVGLVRTALGVLNISFRRFDEEKDKDGVLTLGLEDTQARAIFANKIVKVFADALEGDERFSERLNLSEYCSTTFGYTPITFDAYDWMGNFNHTNKVAFEDLSKVGDCRCWVVFDSIKGDELYRIWLEEKKKEIRSIEESEHGEPSPVVNSGWFLKGLEEALYHAFQYSLDRDGMSGSEPKPSTWENVLDFCQKRKIGVSEIRQNLENLEVAKIFRREMDGKISQTYVAYGNSYYSPFVSRSANAKSPGFSPEHLLFQKVKKEKVGQRLRVIRDSGLSSTGYIQTYRGIGRQLVENSVAYNRLRNGNETKLTLLGQPMFMRGSAAQGQPFKLGVAQGFTLMDPNYTMPDRQFTFDLRQHIEWMRFEEQEYTRETGHHDPKLQLSSRPNKSEVAAKTQEAAGPKSAKNSLKLLDYSLLFMRMIENLVALDATLKGDTPQKESLDYFFEELIYEFREYLPEDADYSEKKKEVKRLLKAVTRISISTAIDDVDAITRALQLVTDPFQINRLERMLFMAMGFGRKETDRLRPLITERLGTSDDEWMAAMENDSLFNTAEIVWNKNQSPTVHLNSHFAKAERVVQGVAQGEDPIRAIKFIQNVLVHSQKHLKHMADHPFYARYFSRFAEGFKRLVKVIPQLEKVARQIIERQQQAKEQGQNPEQTPEMVKALADIKIKEFSAMKKEERTDYLTQVRLRQNQASLEQKEKIKQQEHENKLARQQEISDLKKQLEITNAAVAQLTGKNETV